MVILFVDLLFKNNRAMRYRSVVAVNRHLYLLIQQGLN